MDIDKGLRYVGHAFLWPHAWLSYLYKDFKGNFFQLCMLQDTEAMARNHIGKCWEAIASNDPRRASLQEGVDMTQVIPAWLHGDGVPCTKNDSYEVMSWGPLMSKWMWFVSDTSRRPTMWARRMTSPTIPGPCTSKASIGRSGPWPRASGPTRTGKESAGPRTPMRTT